MNLLADAFAWLTSPERASGALPLTEAIGTHLGFTLLATAIAAAVAIPLGLAVGHTGRGREATVGITGAARALPSFGLVLLLVVLLGVTHKAAAIVIALVLLAIPPILAGTYSGIGAIEPDVIDGARSYGMTERQILATVEIPLALPLLVGGLRSAALQVVATVTVAGYVGSWGLGYYIIQGIQLRDFAQILGASVAIVVVAIALDGLLALGERAATPRGVRAHRRPAPPEGA